MAKIECSIVYVTNVPEKVSYYAVMTTAHVAICQQADPAGRVLKIVPLKEIATGEIDDPQFVTIMQFLSRIHKIELCDRFRAEHHSPDAINLLAGIILTRAYETRKCLRIVENPLGWAIPHDRVMMPESETATQLVAHGWQQDGLHQWHYVRKQPPTPPVPDTVSWFRRLLGGKPSETP